MDVRRLGKRDVVIAGYGPVGDAEYSRLIQFHGWRRHRTIAPESREGRERESERKQIREAGGEHL